MEEGILVADLQKCWKVLASNMKDPYQIEARRKEVWSPQIGFYRINLTEFVPRMEVINNGINLYQKSFKLLIVFILTKRHFRESSCCILYFIIARSGGQSI